MIQRVASMRDPALRARVVRTVPLRYDAGADATLDRPAHVRAGSDIAWAGSCLVVVQDDTSFLALVNPRDRSVTAVALPAGADGRRQFDDTRGNKAGKLDLESVVSISPSVGGGPVVLAFGSGSTPLRQSVVMLRGLSGCDAAGAAVEVLAVPGFYAQLRDARSFAGSELNVEAVVHLGGAPGGSLRMFNRGNGAPGDGAHAINATCDVGWTELEAYLGSGGTTAPPPPQEIVQYDLGAIAGLSLSFTGAAFVGGPAAAARRRLVYTAAAEASPDATRDGPVAGCAIGVIIEDAEGVRAHWTVLEDEARCPFSGKVEGIALYPDDPMHAIVVIDRDAPATPAELCEVVLEGPRWQG